jgi:hypothetical protein
LQGLGVAQQLVLDLGARRQLHARPEQRFQRLLLAVCPDGTRSAGPRRAEREIGRDHQWRLATDRELVRALAVGDVVAATGGQHDGGAANQKKLMHRAIFRPEYLNRP